MMAFPISLADPIVHNDPLPSSADVVVIGGGIIGVMSAWFLARSGLSVVLLEKGRIAAEQSSRNWGWIRQQGRDLRELPIMVEALQIWKSLDRETGQALGFRNTGVTYLAHNQTKLESYESWLTIAQAYGLDTQMLTSKQVAEMLPDAANNWAGAIHTPSDCRAEPDRAVPAIARTMAGAGVRILENCAVRNLDISAGKVTGVITEKGRVSAPEVVLAGGAWSLLFARAHGVDFPQLSVRASVAATQPLDAISSGAMADNRVAFRRREDGGYTLAPGEFHELFVGPDAFRNLRPFLPQLKQDPFGTRLYPAAPKNYPDAWGTVRKWSGDGVSPFEKMRVLNPKPNLRRLKRLVSDFEKIFPNLGPVSLKHTWAGMIDTMPDLVPIIDRAEVLPGLTIATGMSGHGFGIGPAIGRIVADLVNRQPVGHDISPFRLSRFSDGSPIELDPELKRGL